MNHSFVNTVGKMKQRNPAIELYRVMLMFLIVLHHAECHGVWSGEQDINAAWPSNLLFSALTIWHVDGFIAITGWFGTRFSLTRFSKLWGVIAFYSLLSIGYGWIHIGRLDLAYLAGGWFGQTYLYFLFLVPILNAAIEGLTACGGGGLYHAWVLLDIAVVLNWCPYHLLSSIAGNGTDGATIMTFIIVYVNVRLLKLSGLGDFVNKKILLCCFALFLFGVVANMSMPKYFGSYFGSPIVILMAAATLMFFVKYVTLPSFIGRIVTAISPCMFGIYILHDTTIFGRWIYCIPQAWAKVNMNAYPLLIIFISAMLCFIICLMVDFFRRSVLVPLVRPISCYIAELDKRLGFS